VHNENGVKDEEVRGGSVGSRSREKTRALLSDTKVWRGRGEGLLAAKKKASLCLPSLTEVKQSKGDPGKGAKGT